MPTNAPAETKRLADPDLRQTLMQLLEAFTCANELGDSVWEFALQLPVLNQSGVTETAVRWLIRKAYAEHALETTRPSSRNRTFRRVEHLRFSEASCFTLTTAGLRLAHQLGLAPSSTLQLLDHDAPRLRISMTCVPPGLLIAESFASASMS